MGMNVLTKQTNLSSIVIPRISAITSGVTASSAGPTQTKIFVPKGKYTVSILPEGTIAGGTSAAQYSPDFGAPNATIVAFDADTGRPGTVFFSNKTTMLGTTFILAKDSFVYAIVVHSIANTIFDIILTPTYSPFDAYPSITGNQSATATSGSTTAIDVTVYGTFLGWDYDNSQPFIIVPTDSSTTYTNQYRFQSFILFRYNPNTNVWTKKTFTSMSTGTSISSWNVGYGLGYRTDGTPLGFFIKSNFLHNVSCFGNARDAAGYQYGWLKGDISVAGSTFTIELGNTNTAFGHINTDIASGNSGRQLYYWDKINHKVIYNGSESSTYNGTWATYGWRHNWAQWDIATNTNDYTNVNGTVDPRIAGSTSSLGYRYAVPDGGSGRSYVCGVNSTSAYNAYWNRNGSYTGIGNYYTYYPLVTGSAGSYNITSNNNGIMYMPNGIIAIGNDPAGGTIGLSKEYTTSSTAGLLSSYSSSYVRQGIVISLGNNSIQYCSLTINGNIYVLQAAYIRLNHSSSTSMYTYPISLYRTTATTAMLNITLGADGGIPTGTYYSGLNDGSGA